MKTYDTAKAGTVSRAREPRRNSTEAEQQLWRALRETLPAHKWRRQMPIGPYFADFASFADKLVVELDGGSHALAAGYDEVRTGFLHAHGFRVLRFWNSEVADSLDGVLSAIANSLSHREREGAAQPRKGEAGQQATPCHAVTATPAPVGRAQ